MQESNAENDFANKYKLPVYRNAKTRKQHAAYDALMTSNNLVSDFALTWDKKILIKTMWHIIEINGPLLHCYAMYNEAPY